MNRFSFARLVALLRKETIQVMRDAMTLRIIVAIPIMQLFLFGYAINSDPKHLPAGLLSIDDSKYQRTIAAALTQFRLLRHRGMLRSEAEADEGPGARRSDVRRRNRRRASIARSTAARTPSVLDRRRRDRSDRDRQRGRARSARRSPTSIATCRRSARLQPQTPPFQFVVHARYNPEQLTVLNIVPGLICIVLTFSTLFVTTLAITRERERGTMENLLAMPVRPIEVMIAKIVPYVVIGYVQVGADPRRLGDLFLRAADPRLAAAAARRARLVHRQQSRARRHFLDRRGQSDAGRAARAVHADAVVHAVGILVPVSRHARLGAGVGEVFPTTHAMRIVRGMLLKGNGWNEIAPETVADRAVHARRHRLRRLGLSRDAGLTAAGAESPSTASAASSFRERRSAVLLTLSSLSPVDAERRHTARRGDRQREAVPSAPRLTTARRSLRPCRAGGRPSSAKAASAPPARRAASQSSAAPGLVRSTTTSSSPAASAIAAAAAMLGSSGAAAIATIGPALRAGAPAPASPRRSSETRRRGAKRRARRRARPAIAGAPIVTMSSERRIAASASAARRRARSRIVAARGCGRPRRSGARRRRRRSRVRASRAPARWRRQPPPSELIARAKGMPARWRSPASSMNSPSSSMSKSSANSTASAVARLGAPG